MPSSPEDTHGIRIGARRSIRHTDEVGKLRSVSLGMQRMLQIAQQSHRRKRHSLAISHQSERSYKQRCATRLTYMAAKSPGHWYAHGSYIQREAAAGKNGGFSETEEAVEIPDRLQSWQSAGDERIFKLLLSPENAAHLDLQTYTRSVLAAIEKDQPGKMEWVAAIHRNTDHPHVHVAIRGVIDGGRELTFQKQYVKEGLRFHAENIATLHLGYRSQHDMDRDTIKQVTQPRVTPLDRQLQKLKPKDVANAATFRVTWDQEDFRSLERRNPVQAFGLRRRLEHLAAMRLAKSPEKGIFDVKTDYVETLRAIQIAGDKQKMLSRHMEAASATNLPVVSARWGEIDFLQGRILGHGEVEGSERRYMLIESLDGTLYHLPHRKQTEELRAQHQLRKNEVVTITRERGRLAFREHGHADQFLKDKALLAHLPFHAPTLEQPRPGWLGRLDSALRAAQPAEGTEGQHQNDPRVAVRLTRDQVVLLIAAEGRTRAQQRELLDRPYETAEPTSVMGGTVALDYSVGTGVPFAEMRLSAKAAFDSRLDELAKADRERRAARAAAHRDPGRERE